MPNTPSRECFIFDIDGTIADQTHRLHFIEKDPQDWDGFFDACVNDKPIAHVIEVLDALSYRTPIVLASGRSDRVRDQTVAWLVRNGLFFDALYMREAGDHRPDDITKRELLKRIRADGWLPVMAFDDRQRVVDMWRAEGVPCAQVAPGDF